MFEVSRWTVWRWTKRTHRRGRESYKDKPKQLHTIHRKITTEVENAIVILRDSFNWGSQRIRVVLVAPPPCQISVRNRSGDHLAADPAEQTKHQRDFEVSEEGA